MLLDAQRGGGFVAALFFIVLWQTYPTRAIFKYAQVFHWKSISGLVVLLLKMYYDIGMLFCLFQWHTWIAHIINPAGKRNSS